ncbi:MAG: alpha/beta hydrolase [Trueperaceae bacterium]
MFEGFDIRRIEVAEADVNLAIGGSGPALLLLHGYPQTHVLWHKLAPALAERYTVIAADLRGYGDSSKPPGDEAHLRYSKRAMAKDLVAALERLGFDRFGVTGHDRGGRVGHRMALDHAERVERLALLDIAPTHAMYTTADMEFGRAYYHWFFLIQPFDLPERMIGANPEYFLRRKLGQWGRDESAFTPAAMAEYLRCFTAETIHASCEDYRASATVDLEHDEASMAAGQKVVCPVLALWGEQGFVGRKYDVVAQWRKWADDVRGHALPCGHYLPEEAPRETLAALLDFFD